MKSSETPAMKTTSTSKASVNRVAVIVLVVILIGLAGAGFVLYSRSNDRANSYAAQVEEIQSQLDQARSELSEKEAELAEVKDETGESKVKSDLYQSVFLKSGQVYFGKITKIVETQIVLEDIYYLSTGDAGDQGQEVSLVKLGSELHAPEDVMHIERQNVDFWENLKADGQVSQAIDDHKASNQ